MAYCRDSASMECQLPAFESSISPRYRSVHDLPHILIGPRQVGCPECFHLKLGANRGCHHQSGSMCVFCTGIHADAATITAVKAAEYPGIKQAIPLSSHRNTASARSYTIQGAQMTGYASFYFDFFMYWSRYYIESHVVLSCSCTVHFSSLSIPSLLEAAIRSYFVSSASSASLSVWIASI